jgi:hypothetical protein
LKYPNIIKGKLSNRFSKPISNGVIKPIKIAIPLIPLLNIPYGMRKKLKAKATINEPRITIIFFILCTSPVKIILFPKMVEANLLTSYILDKKKLILRK